MHKAMLYGEGWNGDTWDVEEGQTELVLFPRPEFVDLDVVRDEAKEMKKVLFCIERYTSDNGNIYLLGFVGDMPGKDTIERDILRSKLAPV
ncbi:hypothetical protein AB4M04_05640 [Serratia quinivorans]|uniref:Uncharacterized protein n=1 Tax=Serratia quinivorans TaxID=137545 RepID=A0ABV3UHA4_9GAMM